MSKYFLDVINTFKSDPWSRRLVVLNTDDYTRVQPCFLLMHFLKLPVLPQMEVIVYQRSLDYEKAYDDLVYFANVIKTFEFCTKRKVVQLTLVIGNAHVQIPPGKYVVRKK